MDGTAISLGWGEIIKIILGAGFTTAIVNWILSLIENHRKSKKDVVYLALQLAVLLELFAISCADKISTAEYEMSVNYPGNRDFSMPDLLEYPSSDAWGDIPTKLSSRLLQLPNELILGKQLMEGEWLEGDHLGRGVSMFAYLGRYGLLAWDIAVDLRQEYSLKEFSPKEVAWDAIGCLKKMRNKVWSEE